MIEVALAKLERTRIVKALKPPLRGKKLAGVLRQIENAIGVFVEEAHVEYNWEDAEVVGRTVHIKKRTMLRGRPRKDVTRRYIRTLVGIHKDATGMRITRINDRYVVTRLLPEGRRVRSQRERKNPFLLACTRAAGIAIYPRGVIREVLEENL